MMRQYLEQKAAHPNAVLFFRLGDFYEMFFEDAVQCAEILGITLTARAKGSEKVPMCGVPYHAARRYVAKLIEHGLRVAICEQAEVAGAGPGIVRREVIRVVSPGTLLDDESLEPTGQCFLAALCVDKTGAGAALLDASTGDFFCFQTRTLDELLETLAPYRPREVVVSEKDKEAPWVNQARERLWGTPTLATSEASAFYPSRAEELLKRHFRVGTLDAFGVGDAPLALSAAGAALRYVQETQRAEAQHVDRLVKRERASHLGMDASALTHLEILKPAREGARSATLLGVLDQTRTSPGARMLARWLQAPLNDVGQIEARLDAVGAFVRDAAWREQLREGLSDVGDPERLLGRLVLGVGNARDMRALGTAMTMMAPLARSLDRAKVPLLRSVVPALGAVGPLGERLLTAVAAEPPVTLREGNMFASGFNAELDALVDLSTRGKDILLGIEQRERERTKIASLKVRFNKVFGYYLEVTKSNLHLVPPDYQRKQTTVGAERFVTPELKEHEERVLSAEERRCELEVKLFEQLRHEVTAQASAIRAAANAAATLDVLLSFAQCAVEHRYVRPVIDDSGVLELLGNRHPVVERTQKVAAFVPNDIRLGGDAPEAAQLWVITGPNMAGKSTVMRQAALAVVMAQAGCFVAADKARIGLCDRIFTRVGAADNLAQGQSTFMVEMIETSHLLVHATPRSLVLLDEVGRGTSTYDGLSIAWAVAEHLHDHVCARGMFATHYHELTELARHKARLRNVSVAVSESGGRVVFLHKLVAGAASRSYGIEVARLAGLPKAVLQRAQETLTALEAGAGPGHEGALAQKAPQLGLFPESAAKPQAPSPAEVLAEAVAALRVDHMTPLDALKWLAERQQALKA
ncbi:MAG: DNA mismatch repair protein MutS [Myxococcaceae bacterium]